MFELWITAPLYQKPAIGLKHAQISLIFFREEYQLAHLQTIRADSEWHQVQVQGAARRTTEQPRPQVGWISRR